jgi:Kef-type K+ transport system membrane component KefB
MVSESIIFELTVVIVGAAMLGTLFLYGKQPIIIAYIAIGIVAGPGGLSLIESSEMIEEMAHIGVILLLFLIGLNLQPDRLAGLFRQALVLTLASSLVFAAVAFLLATALGFDLYSALIFGAAMMFSSTVIGLKLIPTTTLHHKRRGEIMTSVLLLQDFLAILVILLLSGGQSGNMAAVFLMLIIKLAGLVILSFLGVRFMMIPLLRRYDVIQEYTFLLTLAWCLLWAELAKLLGLSYELGAFIAGLSIASCRAALVISEHLKPLREFFLILFFFAVGARIEFDIGPVLLAASVIFGIFLVPLKIIVFRFAFDRAGEPPHQSRELAARLGQSSEFSLLVVFVALSSGLLAHDAAMAIQIITIVSIIVSTYWVVLKYPTTISGNESLRQD